MVNVVYFRQWNLERKSHFREHFPMAVVHCRSLDAYRTVLLRGDVSFNDLYARWNVGVTAPCRKEGCFEVNRILCHVVS